jgi:succinate dehydrogenase / fumarate reductase cytochrome b subunit
MQATLRLVDTSVGKKALVGVTGAILFGFIIAHALANSLILFAIHRVELGQELLNGYSELMHAVPELLWTARAVLLGSLLVHVSLSMQLARQNAAARPSRYRTEADGTAQGALEKYARYTMIYSGPLIFLYVVFHIAHLTVGVSLPIEGYAFEDMRPYENMVGSFTVPWISAIYIAANLFLGLHLFHGGQALFNTLGLRHPKWDARTRGGAMAIATLVTVSNVSVAVVTSLGLVG